MTRRRIIYNHFCFNFTHNGLRHAVASAYRLIRYPSRYETWFKQQEMFSQNPGWNPRVGFKHRQWWRKW